MNKESCAQEVLNIAIELYEAKKFYEARVLGMAANELGAKDAASLLILVEANGSEGVSQSEGREIFKNPTAFAKALKKAKARIMWRKGQKEQSQIMWNKNDDQ